MHRTILVILFAACTPPPAQDVVDDVSDDVGFPDATDDPLPEAMDDPGDADTAGDAASDAPSAPACQVDLPAPYPSRATYQGIHANRECNNRIPCSGPEDLESGWSALQGMIVFQPISMTSDGLRLLATVAHTEGCTLYAVDASSGETVWCSDRFTIGVAAGSPIADDEGRIYLTDGDEEGAWVHSLEEDEDGVSLRFSTPIDGLYTGPDPATYNAPAGLHFTPGGHVATVTVNGVVVLLDRETGDIEAWYDIRDATGFVPPPSESIPVSAIPSWIVARLEEVIGPMTDQQIEAALGSSIGGSGAFSDNTLSISAFSQIMVVGGGPPDSPLGSVTAVSIHDEDTEPYLTMDWWVPIFAGSSTTPAISPDGRRMAVVDGGDAEGVPSLVYVNVQDCNDNTDDDPDPGICAPAWLYPMLGKPSLGNLAMDEHGTVYAWHASEDPADPDVFAVKDQDGSPRVLWSVTFDSPSDNNMQWTSCITVLDDMVVGSLSDLQPSAIGHITSLPIFRHLTHELVALDRETGEVLDRAELADDSINSLAMGPDGSLYVPLMGMLDLMATTESATFTGGIVQYR